MQEIFTETDFALQNTALSKKFIKIVRTASLSSGLTAPGYLASDKKAKKNLTSEV